MIFSPSSLGNIAAFICAMLIVFFQVGFLPLFEPAFADMGSVWRLIYYGFWALASALSILIFLSDPGIRRRVLPIVVVCALALGLLALHPVGLIAKNLIVALVVLFTASTLALSAGPTAVLRFLALATALAAGICLLDVLFVDGFTTTTGRAAGLGINPNVAAASLLISGSASFWAVPDRYRGAFHILILAAIFATLSKSTLLLTVGVMVVFVASVIVFSKGPRARTQITGSGIRLPLLVGTTAGLLILTGIGTNPRFQLAASESYYQLNLIFDAANAVSEALQDAAEERVERSDLGSAEFADRSATTELDELGMAAEAAGRTNSISARAILFERSFIAFQTGPVLGRGLDVAHQLAPHNTFLLFLVAFGIPGLLIPLGIIAAIVLTTGAVERFQFAAAIGGVMMVSHDILLMPAFLVPLAIGMAALFLRQEALEPKFAVFPFRTVAAATVLAITLGSIALAMSNPGYREWTLASRNVYPSYGHGFAVEIASYPFKGLMRSGIKDSRSGNTQKVVMFEDGEELSNAPSLPSKVTREGLGNYAFWDRAMLLFSSSDNTDPTRNGRAYAVRAPVTVHPLMFLLIGATLIWSIAVFRAFRHAPAKG